MYILALIDDGAAGMKESPGLSRKGGRDQTGRLLMPLVTGSGAIWVSICHSWARTRNKLASWSLKTSVLSFPLPLQFFYDLRMVFPIPGVSPLTTHMFKVSFSGVLPLGPF